MLHKSVQNPFAITGKSGPRVGTGAGAPLICHNVKPQTTDEIISGAVIDVALTRELHPEPRPSASTPHLARSSAKTHAVSWTAPTSPGWCFFPPELPYLLVRSEKRFQAPLQFRFSSRVFILKHMRADGTVCFDTLSCVNQTQTITMLAV